MIDYDKERLSLLMGTNITVIFSNPQSIQEMDTLDYFNFLSPNERTKQLAEMYTEWQALNRIMRSREKG